MRTELNILSRRSFLTAGGGAALAALTPEIAHAQTPATQQSQEGIPFEDVDKVKRDIYIKTVSLGATILTVSSLLALGGVAALRRGSAAGYTLSDIADSISNIMVILATKQTKRLTYSNFS